MLSKNMSIIDLLQLTPLMYFAHNKRGARAKVHRVVFLLKIKEIPMLHFWCMTGSIYVLNYFTKQSLWRNDKIYHFVKIMNLIHRENNDPTYVMQNYVQ